MKTIDTKSLDQNDASSLEARLKIHAANLRGLLSAMEAETISPPTLVAGDLLLNIRLLTAHVNELEHRIGASCPQFSAELRGVSGLPSGVSFAKPTPEGLPRAKTLTDKVLALKGVKTLSQLRQQYTQEMGRGEGAKD